MPSFTPAELALFLTALVAAMVNGALGYGFSSIFGAPLALLLNSQGLARDELRAAIARSRVAESSLTLLRKSQVASS